MTTKYTKSQIVWSNALVWVFLYLLPFILWRGEVVNWGRMAYVHAVILAGCAFVFYFNYFYLTERLLFRKRTGMFFLANTGTALACAACMLLLQRLWPGQAADDTATYITSYASHVVLLAILSGISIIAKTIVKWNDTENRRQVEERRRKEAELLNLRQQLNPHFLFNTLNNIYALIAVDPDKAQSTVLELSKLMRYVLYENNSELVPLHRELDFIRNYVELMHIRLTDNVEVKMDVQVPPTCEKQIAPMLYITLIENAFKHGVSHTQPSFVHVDVRLVDDRIVCTVANSYFPKDGTDKSGSGIGLENLRRRLDILYPHKHILRNEVRGNTYVSELVVPLYPQPPKGGFNAGNQQPPPASPLQGVGGLNTNA